MAHFTIWEAEIALYPTTGDDVVSGDAIWMGCCFEQINLGRQYSLRSRPFLGERYARQYAEDEVHTIELRNPLEVGDGLEIKSLGRFGRHCLVVVWHDEERRMWLKRTYWGVTESGEALSGDVVEMATTLRAERMDALPGRTTWPDLQPATGTGQVDYVEAGRRVPLYHYDGSGVFSALPGQDNALGRIYNDAGAVVFAIEGVDALRVAAAGVVMGELRATGGTFYDTELARLEFVSGGVRVATLGRDGVLAVASAVARSTAPGVAGDIEVRPGAAWSATFGRGVFSAKSFVQA